MKWINNPCHPVSVIDQERAKQRQSQLTKPLGSLGQLETIAIRLAGLQHTESPLIEHLSIAIFAGDHGITEEGVSAFPQEVTYQMVNNFLQGGAAISVLAKQLGATFEVIDTGIKTPLQSQQGLIIQRSGNGTANSLKQEAMTEKQLESAFQAGYDSAERAKKTQCHLFIGGEMGIGNTTSSTALYCALLGLSPEQVTGAGTGLTKQGIQNKITVIKGILKHHQHPTQDILAWLRSVGGFEIVALTGAYLRAAQIGIPILVDGFISSVAALSAIRLQPAIKPWMFFSHLSAESGHKVALDSFNQTPLLDLDLRLGEGSGAALAIPLLQSACLLHNQMATFAEASIAEKGG